MVSGIPVSKDSDLERIYAQARRYVLLSREQERDIDEGKWAAIDRLLALLVEDPFSRHYLIRWTRSCSKPLPEIEKFRSNWAGYERTEQQLTAYQERIDPNPLGLWQE